MQEFAETDNIVLKNVSTTSWSSREAATKCLLLNLTKIHAALRKIATAPDPDTSSFEANNLAKKISKFNFVCGLVVWHKILHEINIVSESLQSQSIDLKKCLELIKNLGENFKKVREDGDIISEWFKKAKKIMSELEKQKQAENCVATTLDDMAVNQRPTRAPLVIQQDQALVIQQDQVQSEDWLKMKDVNSKPHSFILF